MVVYPCQVYRNFRKTERLSLEAIMSVSFIIGIVFFLLLLVVLLYKNRLRAKHFALFLVLITLFAAIFYTVLTHEAKTPKVTEATRAHIAEQQQIYSAWDIKYQKNIDELSRNWTWYHQILEEFKDDSISIQTAHARLTELEKDSLAAKEHTSELAPPMSLDEPTYDLIASICQKTAEYADAQYQTITLTRAASDSAQLKGASHDVQVKMLSSIMNRESPAALFIADEISQIHEMLTVPDDKEEDVKSMDQKTDDDMPENPTEKDTDNADQ